MAILKEVTPQPDFLTSPIIQIRGQSNYYYPDRRLSPENTETLSNINLTERGAARRRNGYSKYNTNNFSEDGAVAITGLAQVKFSSGTTEQVVCSGTKVHILSSGSGAATEKTGSLSLTNTPNSRYKFAFIQNQLIATNGEDETWTYTGSGNAAQLGGILWTKCRDVVIHKNLLFALNTTESSVNYPTRVRWCDVTLGDFGITVTEWPPDNKVEVQENGPAILAGADLIDFFAVVKEDGVHLLKVGMEHGFIEALPHRALTGAFSPSAKNGILQSPHFGLWIIADDGAYVVNLSGDQISATLVTEGIQSEWNALNETRIQQAVSWIREKDHQVRTLLSASGQTNGHNRILVWDWQTGDVWFDTPSDPMNYAVSAKFSNVEYDFLGSFDGYVHQGNDSSETQDDNTDFTWTIAMSPNDLGSPGVDKTIHKVITHFITQKGSQSCSFTTFLNEGRLASASETITVGSTVNWNGAGNLWDRGSPWQGETSDIHPSFINRTAQTVAPQWTGTSLYEIKGYQVTYAPVEERGAARRRTG